MTTARSRGRRREAGGQRTGPACALPPRPCAGPGCSDRHLSSRRIQVARVLRRDRPLCRAARLEPGGLAGPGGPRKGTAQPHELPGGETCCPGDLSPPVPSDARRRSKLRRRPAVLVFEGLLLSVRPRRAFRGALPARQRHPAPGPPMNDECPGVCNICRLPLLRLAPGRPWAIGCPVF